MPNTQGKSYTTPRGIAYDRYINSRAWARKRAEYWLWAGRSCKVDGCMGTDLEVHHHTYERLENEHLSDLVGVCRSHHEEIHAMHDATGRKESLTRITERVVGLRLQTERKEVRARKKSSVKKKTLAELEVLHLTDPPLTPCRCRTCQPRKARHVVGKQVSILDTAGRRERERKPQPQRQRVPMTKSERKAAAKQKVLDQRAARTRAHQQAQEVARRIAAKK